jgi:hypothetical protein
MFIFGNPEIHQKLLIRPEGLREEDMNSERHAKPCKLGQ